MYRHCGIDLAKNSFCLFLHGQESAEKYNIRNVENLQRKITPHAKCVYTYINSIVMFTW